MPAPRCSDQEMDVPSNFTVPTFGPMCGPRCRSSPGFGKKPGTVAAFPHRTGGYRMAIKLILVKPPGATRFNFGAFSLGVLAASIRHLAQVSIIDATGLTVEKAVETVESHDADMVGVTVMGLPSAIQSVEFIERLKSAQHRPRGRRNRRTILAGGHGASMVPEMFLSAGVDAVVMGEGERTVERIFVNGIEPGAPGLACLVDGRMVKGRPQSLIRPLDQLPPPARDLMPPSGDGIHLMETSRGCPHSCAFCETTRFYGRNWPLILLHGWRLKCAGWLSFMMHGPFTLPMTILRPIPSGCWKSASASRRTLCQRSFSHRPVQTTFLQTLASFRQWRGLIFFASPSVSKLWIWQRPKRQESPFQ